MFNVFNYWTQLLESTHLDELVFFFFFFVLRVFGLIQFRVFQLLPLRHPSLFGPKTVADIRFQWMKK